MILAALGLCLAPFAALPEGPSPAALTLPHFPDQAHAFVWRNWPLVPVERMAAVLDAAPDDVAAMGRRMGLGTPPKISNEQWRRSYITIIRRNWHLLAYEQLLKLLDWTEDELAFVLREDDFLYIKLGSLKPDCPPVRYAPPTPEIEAQCAALAGRAAAHFGGGAAVWDAPLFGFVDALSAMPDDPAEPIESTFSPRFCYSYFALYGDPLLEPDLDPFPSGYLARLRASGVGGVWLQGVLYKLTPFPFDPDLSEGWETRLANLRALVERAREQDMDVFLYLNEPWAMSVAFFEVYPDLRGVPLGDHAALCTSAPAVQAYLREAIELLAREVPGLGGIFTITASENPTNCWSHNRGNECARCGPRGAAAVIAEISTLLADGLDAAGSDAQLIAWDWGWRDDWAPEAIALLPERTALQSVSEWSIPVTRGGVNSAVGEYSISVVGPGPRATRHWDLARARGLKTMAKIQANNTWEIAAVPYVPAVENVARHAAGLREAGVDGLQMSWTLGGHPSPNLEVVAAMGRPDAPDIDTAMHAVAAGRVGDELAPALVQAWKDFSTAYSEYPYHGGVMYNAPQQVGPANLLWAEPTGYRATMVCFPYDDLDGWRAVFPPEVLAKQFETMAGGFDAALNALRAAADGVDLTPDQQAALDSEYTVAETCAIHFRSVVNQVRFVQARNALDDAAPDERVALLDTLEAAVRSELELAKHLHAVQRRDPRIGFEASNHYFYVPIDLAEKVLNCEDLLTRWLPALRAAGAE